MPAYIYTARTKKSGSVTHGQITMENEKALAEHLRAKGLILTSAKLATKEKKESKINSFFKNLQGIPLTERLFFTQHLEVMVRTGFSLGIALKTLAAQTSHKRFKEILLDIQKDVESGVSFSKSLKKYPRVFSELFVNMIAAGEESGKMDEVLKRLTIQMKKDNTLRSKIRGALIYPTIIFIAMIGIGTAMIIFVIPKILNIYTEVDATLPLATRLLINISNFVVNNGLIVSVGAIFLVIFFFRLIRTKKGRYIFHRLLLKLPVVANIIKKVNLARFARSLSSLLKTDVPIVKSFKIISRTMNNVHYRNFIYEGREKLKQGWSMAKILQEKPELFPPLVTQMINVGEESGTVDVVSEELASFYEESVDQTMSNLSTIIEPVLMLVIGGAVAVMAVAIIMPMYSLVEQI